jgi:hypothetical protein
MFDVCTTGDMAHINVLRRVWQELEYRIDVCRVTVVHKSNIYSCQKKNFFSFPVAVKNSIMLGPLVFLL